MQGCCRRPGTEVRSADQSAQRTENFSPIFSGWALVAPLCFALQVPDVKGLQAPGPPCASVSYSNFAHATQYIGTCKYTRSWSRSQAVRFQPGVAMQRQSA